MKDNKEILLHLHTVASSCKTRGEMGNKFPKEYKRASAMGVLNELFKDHVKQGYASRSDDELQVLADKCKTRSEFYKRFPGPYARAGRKKLMDSLFAKHVNAGYDGKSLDDIKLAASKCKTRTEMARKFSAEYTAAHKQGMLDEVFDLHANRRFEIGRVENGHWDKETIIGAIKSCKTRSEFFKKYIGAHVSAKRLGIWDEVSKLLPAYLGSRMLRFIYAIIHEPSKTVYVGLSYNPTKRFIDHGLKGRQSVRDLITSGGTLKVLTERLNIELAILREQEIAIQYISDGWNVLNSKQFGQLGGLGEIWTLDECVKVADKCKNRDEFVKKYPSAAFKSRKSGWLDKIFSGHKDNGYLTTRWTNEKLQEIANKCSDRSDMQTNFESAYSCAQKRGLLDDIFINHLHSGYLHPEITFTSCAIKSKDCKSIGEFAKRFPAFYRRARLNKWNDDLFCNHPNKGRVRIPSGWWTVERSLEAAKDCESRTELKRKSRSAYKKLQEDGLLESIFPISLKGEKNKL